MEYRHSKLISALTEYTKIYDKMVWNMVTGNDWGLATGVGRPQEFEEIFGPTRKPDLSGLEYEIGEREGADDEAKNYIREMDTKWMKIYGADDAKTLNLIMKFNGESDALMMRLFKYESNWKINGFF